MRETATAKASRYLCEGRLIIASVIPGMVDAKARGEGALYSLGYRDGTWWCACPARSDQCSHLRALRRVVAVTEHQP